MALSKIWSAFILIAILVAGYKTINGDSKILSRMVTGKVDDACDTVYYHIVSDVPKSIAADKDAYEKYLLGFGYKTEDSIHAATLLLANNSSNDSIAILKSSNASLQIFSFKELQWKLVRRTDGLIETCKSAVTICIGLIGIMSLFMGLMSIAEQAGGIRFLSRIIGPFFTKLFPDVPKGHPALGHMMMNFSANLLGLDNAATPFGLKAMESLQEINPNKETASNAQIMFLCLHASGLTLIPVSIIAARSALKAPTPTDIFIPSMIATFMATLAAMTIVAFKQKINLFQPVILAWIGGISAIIAALVVYITSLDAASMQSFSAVLSSGMIAFIFLAIISGALYKKLNVFDSFIEGAKGGFETGVKIVPYLVGMLAAISMLRTSGAFDVTINGLKEIIGLLHVDTRFVDGLPTALIKPLSGGGARGMMIDTMKNFGPDSFSGRLACILQGSSDTTLYVLAVYFGSVSIRNTRYAVGAMLLADLVGIISSILLCYLFFGNY